MTILYIGYWGVNEGLSHSTIKPHLKILSELEEIDQILFVTIERDSKKVLMQWNITKVQHYPYYSNQSNSLLRKLKDFIGLVLMCRKLLQINSTKHIICRSSLAGIVGFWTSIFTGTKYSVESFEPHAEYMAEAQVWGRMGIKYLVQKCFEWIQLKTAYRIYPVSEGYFKYILENFDRHAPLSVVPCEVDMNRFVFSKEQRKNVRQKLRIRDKQIAMIYVGKFGDIYYKKEAFSFIEKALTNFKEAFFIILTPTPHEHIEQDLCHSKLFSDRVHIDFVDPEEVPAYLSAADIAVSFVKRTRWSFACSPIKTGEYWSSGLPVIMEDDIGDDSLLQSKIAPKCIVSFKDFELQGLSFDSIISSRLDNQFTQLARSNRSYDHARSAYRNLIDSIQ